MVKSSGVGKVWWDGVVGMWMGWVDHLGVCFGPALV